MDEREGEKESWEKFHIITTSGKFEKRRELESIRTADSRKNCVFQRSAFMFRSSAPLNERAGTAGGRAEGSGSTEEERDSSDSMTKCVTTI